MNATTIKKCIGLLGDLNFSELETVLKTEYLKAVSTEPRKQLKLLTAVKTALKHADASTSARKALATVMHTAEGEQFICDGYLIIFFEAYAPELEALPQSSASESVDGKRIEASFRSGDTRALSVDDRAILENIGKYIKIYGKRKEIKVFGAYFAADLLKRFIDIIGTNFDQYTRGRRGEFYAFTEGKRGGILPLRVNSEEARAEIDARTAEFLNTLSENV